MYGLWLCIYSLKQKEIFLLADSIFSTFIILIIKIKVENETKNLFIQI
jgi:hypothetical protein